MPFEAADPSLQHAKFYITVFSFICLFLLPLSHSPTASMTRSGLPLLFLCYLSCLAFSSSCCSASPPDPTLDSLRASLENQEDFILFSLIERARYPCNSPAYETLFLTGQNRSFAELYVRETEAMEAKFGRYQNPVELPFFPDDIIPQPLPPSKFSQFLYPPAASVNASKSIWDMYFSDLLPLFIREGYDGNYQQTVASDLICLQALAKRVNNGRFVAEVKFRDDPQVYIPAILAKDSETLMRLVTSAGVEESVVRRVFEKAKVFGQAVDLQRNETEARSNGNGSGYRVDPSVTAMLYRDWVIPLTKRVEVDYLLHRLD